LLKSERKSFNKGLLVQCGAVWRVVATEPTSSNNTRLVVFPKKILPA
jgi:hypothetical protein